MHDYKRDDGAVFLPLNRLAHAQMVSVKESLPAFGKHSEFLRNSSEQYTSDTAADLLKILGPGCGAVQDPVSGRVVDIIPWPPRVADELTPNDLAFFGPERGPRR